MTIRNKIFYSVLSGILLSVAFPPFPIFITTFFAFIPLFFVLNDGEISTKQRRYSYIYITFFIYHLCSNWWISTVQENSDPYLFWSGIALDIFHPFFFFFPFLLYFISRKLIGTSLSMWLFPLFWTIFEYLHSIGDMGYSWLSIAHTQYTNLLWYQIIALAGIWGATFLLAMANVLIYKIIQNGKNEEGKYTLKSIFRNPQNKIYSFTVYAIFLIPMVYGFIIFQNFDYEKDLQENDYLNIGLIQPNINPWEKWEESKFQQIETHLRLQDSLINAVGKLNLCIWSETAIPVLNLTVNRDLQIPFITNELIRTNTSLLTGIAKYYFYDENEELPVAVNFLNGDSNIPYSSFNTALLINPKFQIPVSNNLSQFETFNDSVFTNRHSALDAESPDTVIVSPNEIAEQARNDKKIIKSAMTDAVFNPNFREKYTKQFHYKAKLTPFAEGFPYVEYLSFAKNWLRWGVGISAWTKGQKTESLVVENGGKTAKIAPIICIESIYPDHVRQFILDGANIITVITNDAWYDGSTGPEQHYIIAATRAIENRRYVARCANSGVTGFILPTGKTLERAPQYKEVAIAASIPILPSGSLTFYSKYGDYLPQFFMIFVVIFVAVYYFRKKRF